jgi:hypothetical protein
LEKLTSPRASTASACRYSIETLQGIYRVGVQIFNGKQYKLEQPDTMINEGAFVRFNLGEMVEEGVYNSY